MYGYTTDIETVEIHQVVEIEAERHDLESLLYKFLDELLFLLPAQKTLV